MLVMLVVLFAFAFGGMLLILVLGARRIEDDLQERTWAARALQGEAARIPGFFVATPPAGPQGSTLDEAAVFQLQRYLDAEQTLADEFVLQPSIESLYRESARRLTVH